MGFGSSGRTRCGRLLTTGEAARLVSRDDKVIRQAITSGRLPAERQGSRYFVAEDDVRRWDAATGRGTRWGNRPGEQRALRALAVHGPLTAEEVGELLERHIGNARKYLAALDREGLVERSPQGAWRLTAQGRAVTAEPGAA